MCKYYNYNTDINIAKKAKKIIEDCNREIFYTYIS